MECNVTATRYDRDFLLQFMEICKDKPETLSLLDAIDPEKSGPVIHPPRRRVVKRAGTTEDVSLIGAGGVKPVPSVPSINQDRPSGTPSPKNDHGNTSRIRNIRGGRCRAQTKTGGQQQCGTPSGAGEPLSEPIVPTEGRWTRQTRSPGQAPIVERKVRALLNKLAVENFGGISDQIIEWTNRFGQEKDGATLIQVNKLVFEKATNDSMWSEMYARLCKKMMEKISWNVQEDSAANSAGKPITGGQLLRKYVLNRCQEDFGRVWDIKEATAGAYAARHQTAKNVIGNLKVGEVAIYPDKHYAALKARRQGLGLVKFIGELFKLHILTERLVHEYIKKLLSKAESLGEEEIESLCELLTTVGGTLDTKKARKHMDIYFGRMAELAKNPNIDSRTQHILLVRFYLRKLALV